MKVFELLELDAPRGREFSTTIGIVATGKAGEGIRIPSGARVVVRRVHTGQLRSPMFRLEAIEEPKEGQADE